MQEVFFSSPTSREALEAAKERLFADAGAEAQVERRERNSQPFCRRFERIIGEYRFAEKPVGGRQVCQEPVDFLPEFLALERRPSLSAKGHLALIGGDFG